MRIEFARELESYKLKFPILSELQKDLEESGSLNGAKIAWHCHLTEITAATAEVILNCGAQLTLSECNPSTSNAEAIKYMEGMGATVCVGPGSARNALAGKPAVLSDTGLELISTYAGAADGSVFAASEITTSGITRLRSRRDINFPVVNINGGVLKSEIENFHGVGDGVVDALISETHRMWCGRPAAVVGYGSVGSGVAYYLRKEGALVTVVEADPIRKLVAHYDGYQVTSDLQSALAMCDLIVTATGKEGLIGAGDLPCARDGILIINVGHFAYEIDVASIRSQSKSAKKVSEHTEEFWFENGKRIYLMTEGTPANVATLSGSPEPTLIHLTTEVLCMNYLTELEATGQSLGAGEIALPAQVEKHASLLALRALRLTQ